MKRYNLLILLLIFALGSCGRNYKNEHAEASAEVTEVTLEDAVDPSSSRLAHKAMGNSETPTEDNPQQVTNNNIKIIRSGNISIESKKIADSKRNMDALLKKFNAYYEQESLNNNNNYSSYTLAVRIPASSFDSFLKAIENGEDKVTSRNINAEDVSIQYYDVESRLKSKRAYLEKYQNMVSSAKSVKDLLEIQEQIRQLQEEIDSSEGVLRSLSGKINYSTLNIQLFEYQANLPMGSNSFWVKIKDSLVFGWNLIETIVIGIVGLWPVWIIVAAVIIILRKVRKNRKLK